MKIFLQKINMNFKIKAFDPFASMTLKVMNDFIFIIKSNIHPFVQFDKQNKYFKIILKIYLIIKKLFQSKKKKLFSILPTYI